MTPWLLRLRPLLAALAVASAANAHADATVTVCGKDAWPGDPRTDFKEALTAGGRISFDCTGTITFTQSHALLRDVEIDGGGSITLDGAGHRMFGLGSGRNTQLTLKAIRIVGGGVGPSGQPGGVVSGEGSVLLLDGTNLSASQQPLWVLAGRVEIRNAWLHDNSGPVVVVSEGTLEISKTTRFTDNRGPSIATSAAVNVRIQDTQFFRNGAASFGSSSQGAAPVCDVAISKSWFSDNVAALDGGAISSRCKLVVEDTQFERNSAGRDGGALMLGTGADANLRAVLFRGNRAGRNGGAVMALGAAAGSGGALSLRNARFQDNQAGATGGAVAVGEWGGVSISLGSFVGNLTATGGGAVYARQSPLRVSRSVFLKNGSQGTGGAIESLCMPPGAGLVANTLISGNVATTGGAFYGTHMRFVNATLVMNGGAAVSQGAVCSGKSDIAFANTIIDGGWQGACAGADALHTFTDLGNNLQWPGHSCGAAMTAALPLLGPFFAPFAPFSPAIGAGRLQACMDPPVSARDLYGTHRPQGGSCTTGAVEGDLSNVYERFVARRFRERSIR